MLENDGGTNWWPHVLLWELTTLPVPWILEAWYRHYGQPFIRSNHALDRVKAHPRVRWSSTPVTRMTGEEWAWLIRSLTWIPWPLVINDVILWWSLRCLPSLDKWVNVSRWSYEVRLRTNQHMYPSMRWLSASRHLHKAGVQKRRDLGKVMIYWSATLRTVLVFSREFSADAWRWSTWRRASLKQGNRC